MGDKLKEKTVFTNNGELFIVLAEAEKAKPNFEIASFRTGAGHMLSEFNEKNVTIISSPEKIILELQPVERWLSFYRLKAGEIFIYKDAPKNHQIWLRLVDNFSEKGVEKKLVHVFHNTCFGGGDCFALNLETGLLGFAEPIFFPGKIPGNNYRPVQESYWKIYALLEDSYIATV